MRNGSEGEDFVSGFDDVKDSLDEDVSVNFFAEAAAAAEASAAAERERLAE